MFLDDLVTTPLVAAGVVISTVLYLISLIFYRLYLHPLAKFPGPKIAASTVWYEFYYDGIKRGQYTFKIAEMHRQYGPLVRISPNELHCNDPAFIDTLYAGGSVPRDKYEYFASQFGIPESVFGTVHHKLHRLRRGAMNKFFSKASVVALEPMIHEKIEKLCSQLSGHSQSGKPVQLSMAFSCLTTDVVTEYAFAKSYNFLDSPTFEPNFHRAIIAGTDMGPFIKQFPWIFTVMKSLPDKWVEKLNPEMGVYLKFQEDVRQQIRALQQQQNDKKMTPTDKSQPTIFHELLRSSLPEQEKSIERLWQEGQIIIGAGTETTAWTLSVILFYVLNDMRVFNRLYEELSHALPEKTTRISCNELERLPYLISYYSTQNLTWLICLHSAVISEGLRLSYGVSTRLQRVSPDGPMIYRPGPMTGNLNSEYEIPQGVPVGMTSVLVHLNPELFPRPSEFEPERWLDINGNRDRSLEKYILSFSRGSRQCLGINLAYTELFMGTGLLLRRLGPQMKLFETARDDVEILHDCFVPTPKADTKGIRIIVE